MYATKTDNPYSYIRNNLTISNALNILDGRRVIPGKKTRCPSPHHSDNHPSCDINNDDTLFHCKTCGVGGDVISLIEIWFEIPEHNITACERGFAMLGREWPKNGNKGLRENTNRNKLAVVNGKDPRSKHSDSEKNQDKTLKTARAIERDSKVEEWQAKCEDYYDYSDYNGNPAFRVFRLPGKEFRQTTWNGRLYVSFKATDARQYLYNVQAVRQENYCVITEGEKDADALIKLGIVATTWPGGAKNLKPLLDTWDLFEPLRGKEVVWFAPDPDDAGENAFEDAVPYINGFVDEFRKVKWPGVKDAHDFVSQFSDDKTAKTAVWDVLIPSPEYVPGLEIPNVLTRVNRLKNLDIPQPTWVVEGMIQVGYTMVVGRSKARKTMFLQNLALAVATGRKAIGNFATTTGTVIYCSLEDDLGSSKAKFAKMLGHGHYPSNLLVTCEVDRFPALESKIIEWHRAFPDLKMVVLDNLTLTKKLKGAGNDVYDNEYVEQNHFKKFARKLGIALVIVHHAGKNETGDITRDTLGTTAYIGAPDKLILIQRPVNEDKYNNILSFMNRNSADQERMALKFYPDLLSFDYMGPVEELERTELQEQVLELLAGHCKAMKPTDIAKTLNRKLDATNKLLQRMLQKGLVKRPKTGLYEYIDGQARKQCDAHE